MRIALFLFALLLALPAQSADLSDIRKRGGKKFKAGDFQGARKLMHEGLKAARKDNQDQFIGFFSFDLGATYENLKEFKKSLEHNQESLRISREFGDGAWEVLVLRKIASVHAKRKDLRKAIGYYEMSRKVNLQREEEREAAKDLNTIAKAYIELGETEGAVLAHERALDIYRKMKNDYRVRETLRALVKLYGPVTDRKKIEESNRLIKELDRKIEKLKSERVKKGDGRIDGYFNKAIHADRVGNRENAMKAWREMIDFAKGRFKKSKSKHAGQGISFASFRLATYLGDSGEYKKAFLLLEEGAAIAKEVGNPSDEITALTVLGTYKTHVGKHSEAIAILKKAVKISRQSGNLDGEINGLRSIGMIYQGFGNIPQAEKFIGQAHALAKRHGRMKAIVYANTDLGRSHNQIADYEAAADYYLRALKIARQVKDRALIASALNSVGIAYTNLGESDKAVEALEEAQKLRPWGGTIINLGDAHWVGGRHEKAVELYGTTIHTVGIGRYHLLKKEYEKAKTIFEKILVKDSGRASEGRTAEHTGAGLAFEGLKQYKLASDHYQKSKDILERRRGPLSDYQRLRFLTGNDWLFPRLEPYEGLVRVTEFLPGGLRGAMNFTEFTRSRSFTEAAARRYGRPETRIPAELAKKEDDLNRRIAAVIKQMDAANAGNSEHYLESEKQLKDLRKEQNTFIYQLRRRYPEYASAIYPKPVYPEDIPLEPDEVLIEYEITAPYSKVFVVKSGKIVLSYNIDLSRKELSLLVKRYHDFFEGVEDTARLAAYDPHLGKRLYDLLLKPAFEAEADDGDLIVPKDSKIIIIPDEILGILPFESLVLSAPKRSQAPIGKFGPVPVGVRYVADDYDITYSQSATALTAHRNFSKKKKKFSKELLILADPVFTPADSRARGVRPRKDVQAPHLVELKRDIVRKMGLGGMRRGLSDEKKVASDEDAEFPRLDKTSILADVLSKKVFKGQRAEVLIGLKASEEELNKRDLSQYRYLVFATHGILDNTIVGIKEPALVLRQFGISDGGDGYLTMGEIMRLDLDADLVALTACRTGLGKYVSGEGVMGLGRAFQYAGAKNVLISLWNVSEDSTTMLAKSFFENLQNGKSKRESLRLARAEVRRAGYGHPFYWAPFILFGE